MVLLLYGAGLRLLECARLRIKDVDFASNQIVVRDGKGFKDRVTMLPASVKAGLAQHLDRVRRQHQFDLERGAGWVELPYALKRKYPSAGREWAWQWVFPATRIYVDRVTGERRRHHLHESVLQCAVKDAVRRAGIAKPASCHTPATRSPRTCWRIATTSGRSRVRPQRREHDADLHARPEQRAERGPESRRPPALWMSAMGGLAALCARIDDVARPQPNTNGVPRARVRRALVNQVFAITRV